MNMAYGPTSIGGYMALSPATKEDIGGVKIGKGINVESDGTINVESIDNVNNFKFKAQTSDPGAGSPLETGTVLFVYS
jgi:hypothetical protein